MIFLIHEHCVMCGDKCILKYQSQHFTIKTNCNILPKTRSFPRCQHFVRTQNQPQCPPSSSCYTSKHSTSQHHTLCTYQRFALLLAYIYQKDERALSEQQNFGPPPPPNNNAVRDTSPLILLPIFSCPFSCYSSSWIKASILFSRHRYDCHFAMKLSGFARSSFW
jgi:hypothetical protein